MTLKALSTPKTAQTKCNKPKQPFKDFKNLAKPRNKCKHRNLQPPGIPTA